VDRTGHEPQLECVVGREGVPPSEQFGESLSEQFGESLSEQFGESLSEQFGESLPDDGELLGPFTTGDGASNPRAA
jgi:hypothetical protein